jgi:hypothetical protein
MMHWLGEHFGDALGVISLIVLIAVCVQIFIDERKSDRY